MICCGLDLKYWDDVKYSLQEAFENDYGRMSINDIKDAIECHKMQMWGIHDGILRAVMITEIIDYPQLRSLRVVAVAGKEMDTWLDVLLVTIEQYGAENSAHILEFTGRKGWEKVLTKHGWGNTQIVMSRTI